MAFNYRTGASIVLSSLSADDQAKVSIEAVAELQKYEKNCMTHFAYQLPPFAMQKLWEHGVELSSYSFRSHSHPVSKTIENHLLFRVLPNYIDDKFIIIGMKEGKLNYFRSRGKVSICENINRYVHVKDLCRYSYDYVSDTAEQKLFITGSPSTSSLIPKILHNRKKPKRVFLHDELHYWSNSDLSSFLDALDPEVVIGTHIYPKELLRGSTTSLNSWCYTYEVEGDKLLFSPDGKSTEMYTQPVSGFFLLKANRFVTKCGAIYQVNVLYTLYAHSIIMLSKTDLINDDIRIFDDFDTLSSAALNKFGGKISDFPRVRTETVKKIILYMKTLKKPDAESALAKLRQLQDDVEGVEIVFIAELGKMLCNVPLSNQMIMEDTFKKMVSSVVGMFPERTRKFFSSYNSTTLTEFIATLENLRVVVDCKQYDWDDIVPSPYDDELEGVTDHFSCWQLGQKPCGDYVLPRYTDYEAAPSHRRRVLKKAVINGLYSGLIKRERLESGEFKLVMSDQAKRFFLRKKYDIRREVMPEVFMRLAMQERLSAECETQWNYLCGDGDFTYDALLTRRMEERTVKNRGLHTKADLNDEVRKRYSLVVNDIKDFKNSVNLGWGFSNEFVAMKGNPFKKIGTNLRTSGTIESKAKYDSKTSDDVCAENDEGLSENGNVSISEIGAEHTCETHAHVHESLKVEIESSSDDDRSDQVNCESFEEASCMGDEKQFQEPIFFEDLVTIDGMDDEAYNEIMRSKRAINTPGDGNCFFHVIGSCANVEGGLYKDLICRDIVESGLQFREPEFQRRLEEQMIGNNYADSEIIIASLIVANLAVVIVDHDAKRSTKMTGNELAQVCLNKGRNETLIYLLKRGEHYELLLQRNNCVIKAISEATSQSEAHLTSLLRSRAPHIAVGMEEGVGCDYDKLEEIFNAFNINAKVLVGGEVINLNEKGTMEIHFSIDGDHMTFAGNSFKEKCKSSRLGRIMEVPKSDLVILKNLSSLIKIEPNFERANLLEESLMRGYTGIISSSSLNGFESKLSNKNTLNFSEREIGGFFGTFGSGKSHHLKKFLKAHRSCKIHVVVPRKNLSEDWLNFVGEKSKGDRFQIKTFETFIRCLPMSSSGLVILDEFQLFPPGYIDYISLCSKSSQIMIAGDPVQPSYDSEKDRNFLGALCNEANRILDNKAYKYNVRSRRFNNKMYVNRLPCRFKMNCTTNLDYFIFESMDDYKSSDFNPSMVLVPSIGDKRYYSSLFKGKKVSTYGESTGLTVPTVLVVIGLDSYKSDYGRQLVAVSRARDNIGFFFEEGTSARKIVDYDPDMPIAMFLTGRANETSLMETLPGNPNFVDDFCKIGSDYIDREERLSGDPWLKTQIFLGQRENCEEVSMEEINECEFFGKTHMPLESLNSYIAMQCHNLNAKENREVRIGWNKSEQFSDQYPLIRNGAQLTNQAERFESIYPRHKSGDTVTFIMAVKKRLRTGNPMRERAKLKESMRYGKEMLQIFNEKVKFNASWDSKLFESCQNDFEVKKLMKSQSTLENHNWRSNRDWNMQSVFLFMKSQLCSKYEKRFCDAKAGQTLACFSHVVLCRLAPYIRYIEKKLNASLPSNFYIHNGKNFDQLNSFVKLAGFKTLSTESDYESFDASQDSMILAFEVCCMKQLNLPNDFIEDYIDLKCNLKSKLGNLAIMRFTGEAGTFLFNTMANMLFTFMTYECKKDKHYLFAGDDMCVNGVLPKVSKYDHILKRMSLKAKVGYSKEPTFCGWLLTDVGIIKRPELVLDRWLIAKEKCNLPDCADNYAIEASFAYKLGDRLVDKLCEKQMCAYYILVREIIKNKHLLKSDVKKIFENGC